LIVELMVQEGSRVPWGAGHDVLRGGGREADPARSDSGNPVFQQLPLAARTRSDG